MGHIDREREPRDVIRTDTIVYRRVIIRDINERKRAMTWEWEAAKKVADEQWAMRYLPQR